MCIRDRPRLPLVAVMVTGYVPGATAPVVVSVSVVVPLPVTVPGLNPAVTPAGSPLTANPTLPVNPFCPVIVTVYPALLPAATRWLAGVVPIVKSAGGVTTSVMLD